MLCALPFCSAGCGPEVFVSICQDKMPRSSSACAHSKGHGRGVLRLMFYAPNAEVRLGGDNRSLSSVTNQ